MVAKAMLSKVPGKDVTVHIIAARVRMDMKVCENDVIHCSTLSSFKNETNLSQYYEYSFYSTCSPASSCNVWNQRLSVKYWNMCQFEGVPNI